MNELTIIENNGILVINSETMKESQNAKLRSDNF